MGLSAPLARYVMDAKLPHGELQRALTQLSGFLLKRYAARRAGALDFGPVEAARTGLAECGRLLAGLRVPADAAHHRFHLDGAHEALLEALDAALGRGGLDDEAMFAALERAERELRALWRILPGFAPVDFSQACCAAYGHLRCEPASASP